MESGVHKVYPSVLLLTCPHLDQLISLPGVCQRKGRVLPLPPPHKTVGLNETVVKKDIYKGRCPSGARQAYHHRFEFCDSLLRRPCSTGTALMWGQRAAGRELPDSSGLSRCEEMPSALVADKALLGAVN